MELYQNYVLCERSCEGISGSIPGQKNFLRSNLSVEVKGPNLNAFHSSCSNLKKPFDVSYNPPFSDHLKASYPLADGHSTTKLSPAIQKQMSGFERACYEDFQMYIPEITAETKFASPRKLCEENADFGVVHPTMSQDFALNHHVNPSHRKVLPSETHSHYNKTVMPFTFKSLTNKIPRSLGNCSYNVTVPSEYRESTPSWAVENNKDLQFSHSSSWPLKGTSQVLPLNNAVSHFMPQQRCPTVSIRVDISCPLLPCGHSRMSCCCRDAYTTSPEQSSYNYISGNLGQGINGVIMSDNCQSCPGSSDTSVNSFAGTCKLSHATDHSRGHNTGFPKSQFKSDDRVNNDMNSYPQRFETVAKSVIGHPLLSRANDHAINMYSTSMHNDISMTHYQLPRQKMGSKICDSLNSRGLKYQNGIMPVRSMGYSADENSCISSGEHSVKVTSFHNEGTQGNERIMYFPKTSLTSCRDIVELRPIDPGKVFGQCKFQDSGNMASDEQCTYAESTSHSKKWQVGTLMAVQADIHKEIKRETGLSELLLDAPLNQPSSPIANLSSLVAKIDPEHGNIMTGQKNIKVEG